MIRLGRIALFVLGVLVLLPGAVPEVRADATCSVGGAVAEPLEGKVCNGDLTILGGTTSTLNGDGTVTVTGDLVVEVGAVLDVIGATTHATLDVGGDFDLQTNAVVDLDARSGVAEPSGTGGAGHSATYCAGSGAGHGGAGGPAGTSSNPVAPGSAYGIPELALLPGSLGGQGTTQAGAPAHPGGAGGGSIRILVGGLATLDGLIRAVGGAGEATDILSGTGGSGGGGSGGSVYLKASDLTTHNPGTRVQADGGDGGNGDTVFPCSPGGGGAGGRITMYFSGINGAAGGTALDATHLSCTGGARGTGNNGTHATAGADGSCLITQTGGAPQVSTVTPDGLGQGAANRTLTVTGSGFVAQSRLSIDGASPGVPANGITVQSVTVASAGQLTATVSVDYTADAAPGANPKLVQVFNPDLSTSPDQFLFSVRPAPVIDHVEQGGLTVTGLPRGFSGPIVIHGSDIQADAALAFGAGGITATGTPSVDVGAQTITVAVSVGTAAVAGPVTIDVTNPDGGTTEVSGSLDVLSAPVITGVTPDILIVGQTGVQVVVTGSGFIAAAQLVSEAADVTVDSVRFDGFTQLTATLSVAVAANLTTATRNLHVDNGDGGVSPAVVLTLEPVPAGMNAADLVYSDGSVGPADRLWNGFGWGAPGNGMGALPEVPEWVLTRPGRTAGDLGVATVDATRRLHLRERVSDVWGTLVGPIALAVAPGRPVDAVAVAGAGGERFLTVYGEAGSAAPTFRLLGGGAATGSVPVTDPACGGGTEVPWVRLVADTAGDRALLAYAPDNGALCAIPWDAATGFDAASEIVLAAPGTLASVATMAFDATFWGTTGSRQGMVAWGVAGSAAPGYALWNGAAWVVGSALSAASTPTATVKTLRLTASPRSARVALADLTSIGELYVQVWGGTRWGESVPGLPFGLVSNPGVVAGPTAGRAFDLGWSSVLESLTAVYGLDADAVPKVRRWTPAAGWTPEDAVPAPAGAQVPAWVQFRSDPATGGFLAGILDDAGALGFVPWDGVQWGVAQGLGAGAPIVGESFMAAYRTAPSPGAPQVTDLRYAGASPATLGAQSTGQTLEVIGSGFLNAPAVSFSHTAIAVQSVNFLSSTRVLVDVDIGAVPAGAYAVTLTNPDGQSSILADALQVVAAPSAITIRLGSGAPACTPTVAGAAACAFQGVAGVPVEVLGTGFVDGATVGFGAAGVTFQGPAVLSVDGGTGQQVLSGTIDVSGAATPGAGDVTVTNPDSSTGTGAGVFEVVPSVTVTSITPDTIGAGARDVTLDVRGTNFQSGVGFDLGSGVSVTSVAVASTTQALLMVDVASAAAAGPRTVTATNPDGGQFMGASPVLFTVNTAPTVTSVAPASGDQGATVNVVVDGADLTPLAAVDPIVFSGTGITVSAVTASSTQVSFDATIAADADFDLARDLTLTRADLGQVLVSGAFSVTPVPTISDVTPTDLVTGELGRAITITGNGFDSGARVVIDPGVTVYRQNVVDPSQIDLAVDVGPATGTFDLVVQSPGGQVSAAQTLTVTAAQPCTVGSGQSLTFAPDGAQALACSTLSVTGGGTVLMSGDVTVHVLGDADVTGATVTVDSDMAYGRLRVDGALNVGAGGVITASGLGRPGGEFGADGQGAGGGAASSLQQTPNNSGRGGGYGGAGGDGSTGGGGATNDLLGTCSGAACFQGMPIVPGSGGGSGHLITLSGTTEYWRAGGAGGGAIVVDVAGAATVNGTIVANGANGKVNGTESGGGVPYTTNFGRGAGGGSGGSVLLLADGNLSGAGILRANGGNGTNLPGIDDTRGTGGGGGRVAVYYGGANTFTGTLDCVGGTSVNNTDPAFQGATGTCFTAAQTTIASVTPTDVARGSSTTATLQGTGLVTGDGVVDPGGGITWGDLTGTGPAFAATVDVSQDASVGPADVVVRHADQTGGIAFRAINVVGNPLVFSVTPNHLAQGDVAAVQLAGGLLEPAGAAVTFLRAGSEPQCGGSPCVAAVVDEGSSSNSILSLTVTVAATAPIGAYDVRVDHANGGSASLAGGFAVVSTDGSVPAITAIQPTRVGEGVTNRSIAMYGYDFGVPGTFAVDDLPTSDPAVTLAFDPAGCPLTPGDCVADPAALQRIDALVTTVGATAGSLVDVGVAAGAQGSTLPQALTITPRPVVTSFTPTSGEATFTLTVSGTDFATGAIVSLEDPTITVGATTAAGADLTANVSVGALVATGATAVRVTNPDGGFGTLAGLNLNPPPTLASVSPATLSRSQVASVVLTGTHFHPNAIVDLGSEIAVSNVVWGSATQITVTATVSAAATPGARTVTVTNPNGASASLTDGVTILRPVVLTSISPSAVGAGGTHTLLLVGAEFSSGLGVGNITISGTGITKVGVFHYRANPPIGQVTITSADLVITVAATAATGPRTLTLTNADGSHDSATFTINPPPTVAFVAPGVVVRNPGVEVAATINGFGFDTVAPRVCFGSGCDFGATSSPILVTAVTPVHQNRIDVTLQIDNTTTLGFHPVTVANSDGGRVTKTGVLEVVDALTVDPIADFEIPAGTGPVAQTITGTGFTDAPNPPQVAFLTAAGAVDTDIAVGATFVSATAIDLSITVGAGAAPGLRAIRVTNGDGSVAEVAGFLLITNATGPTIGPLVPGTLGLDAAGTRTVNGVVVTGSGLDGGGLTLAFDRAGLTVTNVVAAAGGKSATFDLDLAATTVPGLAALTATTSGGADTRAGALRVNVAPVVTALQPAVLTPATSNASVLLSGGGFQPGAQVEVAPAGAGVTVRDLDTSVAGTQANFLTSTALRTVVTADTTADGAYTLTVVNVDGGRGAGTLTVSPPDRGTPAMTAYLKEITATGLKVRGWDGATLLPEVTSGTAALPHPTDQTDLWTELRANPLDPGEYLLAVGRALNLSQSSSDLYLYRLPAGGSTWGTVDAPVDAVGGLASTTTQVFDLAFEQAGPGRALLVYGVGPTLLFKTISGGSSSGAATVLPAGAAPLATGDMRWVRLIPEPHGRRILVMYMTATRQTQALIWDGAAGGGVGAFVTQYDSGGLPLTANAVAPEAAANGVQKPGFDGAWEGVTGHAVAFYSESGTNALQAVTWDAAAGWGAPASSGQLITGSGPTFVEAEADPNSDRIAVLSQADFSTSRSLVARFYLGGWVAGGTTLAATTTLRPSTNLVELYSARNFDMAWNDDGELVAMFDSTSGVFTSGPQQSLLDTRIWRPATGWGTTVDLAYTNRLVAYVDLDADPFSGDVLALVGLNQTITNDGAAVRTVFLHWADGNWTGQADLASDGAHFIAGGPYTHNGTALAVAFQADNVPPAPVVLTQTGGTSTTATVAWNAPGDNGASGQAGGYDIRWAGPDLTIVDDAAVPDCASPPVPDTICFSNATQVRPSPTPRASGTAESVEIDLGAPGLYTVAVKTGDRANVVDAGTGAETLAGNVSALSNVLTVATLAADGIAPEAVTDLAAAAGASPETMIQLTWTGVGDDGDMSTQDPVRAYDLRMAPLPISEVGGDNNFHVPFDRATRVTLVTPATDGTGGTRGVANTYTATGLDPGTTYHFAVKGLDEDATPPEAPVSNDASLTTALVTPTAIDDLVVADVGANEVTLAWTARGGGPTAYELRFSTAPIVTAGDFDAAVPVGGLPTPVAAGTRQVFTVGGLVPETLYYFALVPVRFQTIGGVLTRLAPDPAGVFATTLADGSGNTTAPTAIGDLSEVSGTVRTGEVRLAWTAPGTSGVPAVRYEFRWAHRPLATAAPAAIHVVPVPMLPGAAGSAQEYTVRGLPENTLVYIDLVAYNATGFASFPSNEVLVHTALRGGMNAVSVPGTTSPNDLASLLGPYVATCTSDGGFDSGSGSVGGCGVGEATVIAYAWDPAADGGNGDFVAMDQADPVAPGAGIFVFAAGTRAVVDVGGTDEASYPALALSDTAPTLVSNPYFLPVAVADLRVTGDDGYNEAFPDAVLDGVVDSVLRFYTREGGVLKYVDVTTAGDVLPYRAYFVQLGPMAATGVAYQLEVPHP